MYRSTPVIDEKCQMLLLAKDGVYLPTAPRAITQGLLASGNRADVLIKCPEGDFEFNSTEMRGAIDQTVLLHIHSVVNNSVPSQCDLPVFEVNRPCCD